MNRRILALALVAALALAGSQVAGCKRLSPGGGPKGETKQVRMEILVKAVDPAVAKGFRDGDPVRIKDTGSGLGKIVSVTTTPTLMAVPTADGRVVAAPVPDQVDVHVFVEGNAVAAEDGYRFSGEPVWVNSELKIVTTLEYAEALVLSLRETGK